VAEEICILENFIILTSY